MFREEREKFPPKSKDTKKWCKGKKGVEHQLRCIKVIKKYNTFQVARFEHVCSECGKTFDFWYEGEKETQLFCKPQPNWVILDTEHVIVN